MMRLDTENPSFPYEMKFHPTNCYFATYNDGTVKQLSKDLSWVECADIVSDVKDGKARLFCSWTGKWRTDLFEIQDVQKFAEMNHF
jgi:hypothetical protein